MYLPEQVRSRKTRRTTLREVYLSDVPEGDRTYLPDSGRKLPGQGGVWQGIGAAAGPGGPEAIQQKVEKSPEIQGL